MMNFYGLSQIIINKRNYSEETDTIWIHSMLYTSDSFDIFCQTTQKYVYKVDKLYLGKR